MEVSTFVSSIWEFSPDITFTNNVRSSAVFAKGPRTAILSKFGSENVGFAPWIDINPGDGLCP